jgi:hypothetical protein
MEVGRAFPLDAYSLTGTQVDLINQAVHLLESKCVAAKGFDLPPLPTLQAAAVQNRLVVKFGLGILSEAQQFGYEKPPKYTVPPAELGEQPSAQYAEALTEALYGPAAERPEMPPVEVGGGQLSGGMGYTPDSCMGVAYGALDVSPARSQELSMMMGSAEVANIDMESRNRTDADPLVLQVTGEWSTCMAGKGFTAVDPSEASVTYGPGDRATAVAAATADVQCKYDTNYFGVIAGTTSAYQQQLIEEHSLDLEALAASNRDILDKANAVVEAG